MPTLANEIPKGFGYTLGHGRTVALDDKEDDSPISVILERYSSRVYLRKFSNEKRM